MSADSLTVMITPSAAGTAWRNAVAHRGAQIGWGWADVGPEGPPDGATGLFFAHDHAAIANAQGHRALIIDTTAIGTADPSQPATGDDLIVRAHALVEAEAAARQHAPVFNAARYQLDLPGLGLVERPDGERYRIHPDASESPLALFDQMPVPAGAWANWAPRWFAYSEGVRTIGGSTWIDMTGRMRPLVYGPYVRLPVGRWRVDVRFSVDPERAHAPLLFEWGSGNDFCRVMTEIRHPGTYGVHMDRFWTEADAAQLRIWTAHPVFEGRIDFQGARVTRVADDDPSPLTPLDRIVEAGVI